MSILKYNRTKIVCTIGPASESEERLRELIMQGMDVVRLNFSHGSHAQHLAVIERVRKLNEELEATTSLLVDLQGPKIRMGALDHPYHVNQGDHVIFDSSVKEEKGNVLPIQYETFASDVEPGDLVLVDDGKVELRVLTTDKSSRVELQVLHGHAIGSKKGVNLPFTNISLPSLTEKDLRDLEFALEHNVDWIALSFVRTAEEVRQLKKRIDEAGVLTKVISKIEKPEALRNIDEIIDITDGVMIARGDLGVEIPLEDVPMWQKTIIKKCNFAARPVIVATQMMETMIHNRRPTRAETSDVANAVMDGADALMLSGETSVGEFPAEVVMSMQRIISSMEQRDEIYYSNMEADAASPTYLNDSVNITACELAEKTNADAIVGMTVSGYTAFHLSRCRPRADIFIFSPRPEMRTILNLVWGVRSYEYDKYVGTDETISDTTEILRKKGFLKRGDIVINTASIPIESRQRTNMIKIDRVE